MIITTIGIFKIMSFSKRKKKKYYKKAIENSVDSAWLLAYNDIEAESLLRNLKGAMHNTKGGMLT